MAAKTRRAYQGGAAASTLSAQLNQAATSATLSAATGWPSGAPFYVVVDPGTSSEEKMLVTRSGTSLTITTRGADNTSDVQHSSGAAIYPVFTAVDADEANELTSTFTTKGDLATFNGTTFARQAVGSNNQVLVADSAQTNGIKWASVTGAMITDLTVDTADINDSAVTAAKIASAVAGAGLSGGAGTALAVNIDDSTIEINSDTLRVKDSGIVEAKVADGAITSAKIQDDTIVNADINASAAIVDTKLATIATAGKVSNSATTATSSNTANAIVARNASGNFTAGMITANLTGAVSGNATTATTLAVGKTIALAGDVTATGVSFDGGSNISLTTSIANSAVDTPQLAAEAVTNAKIQDNTILGAKIASTAALVIASLETSGNIQVGGTLRTNKNTNDTYFKIVNAANDELMQLDSNQGVHGNDLAGLGTLRALYSLSDNRVGFSSSSQRFKEQVSAYEFNADAVLGMIPVRFKYRKAVEEQGDDAVWHYGFIAEQADQNGLSELVQYDADGLVEYFAYERMCVAQQQLIRDLYDRLDSLEARLEALESK